MNLFNFVINSWNLCYEVVKLFSVLQSGCDYLHQGDVRYDSLILSFLLSHWKLFLKKLACCKHDEQTNENVIYEYSLMIDS